MTTIQKRSSISVVRATMVALAFTLLASSATQSFAAISFSPGQTVKAKLMSNSVGGSTTGNSGATFRLYNSPSSVTGSSDYTEQWGSDQGGLFKWNNVQIDSDGAGPAPYVSQGAQTFLTSCIEVVQNISYGSTFTYTVADLATAPIGGSSTPMTSAKANLVQSLFNSHYPGSAATKEQAGAFQIALWKIVYDGGYDATTNNFTTGGRMRLQGSPNANGTAMLNSAASMLTGLVPAAAHPFVYALTSTSSQDQLWGIVVEPQVLAAVPEPASLVVWSVLAGGAAGLAVRRRRKASQGRWSPEAREAIFDIVQGRAVR